MVVVHTRELRKQWLSAIAGRSPSLDVGLIAAGCAPNPYAPVQVAQVQSLVARLKMPPKCDLMVIDEAHHSAAKTYMRSIDRLDPVAMLGIERYTGQNGRKRLGSAVSIDCPWAGSGSVNQRWSSK